MKYLMLLIFLFNLWLAEHLIYSGHAGWGYTAMLGALAAAIVMINAIVEGRVKQRTGK